MRVAVVGGGIYGITTALELDKVDCDVDLFEKGTDIMKAASWTNQWRLHRGYHYPRSEPTAQSCQQSSSEFEDRYPDTIIKDTDHYYCIAKERTKTTGDEFISFCEEIGLEYEFADPDVVNGEKIDVSLRVSENRIDPHALLERFKTELSRSDVDIHLDTEITDLDDLSHDYVVVATYAGINQLFDDQESLKGRYKFQLCEKPVVRLPPQFARTSVVVMDGPFMCFDPYGRTGNFLLGNVVHAVHETSVGQEPDFSPKYDRLLNNGIIRSPDITKFDEFVSSGEEFMPGLSESKHVGSLYTIRTVLAGVEDTDERPTIVEREGNVFKIFSGKIASCVPASRKIVSRIKQEVPQL